MGLLPSQLVTNPLMTVLERSPRSGDARWVDGACARSSATPTDGEDGQVSSRGPRVVRGGVAPMKQALVDWIMGNRHRPFGRWE
jgi:hypothetical protein